MLGAQVSRRGAKRALEPCIYPTDIAKPLCDAERHEMHYHAERGNDNDAFRQLYRPLREQARSHGLRPASKAELCITMSAGTRVISQVSSIYQR
ncbi:hypothetical protein BV360_05226 [Pseudomonas syringae pv. actinidiae]|nr:hypothetical protein BV340_05138 [Pseudomonas syringae pv. actinidiae]OSN13259.1 hypothetical protein BV339_05092 [Pseudomonas syringae pv. actinidiae]OSN15980.1 hypothetical protein BV341_05226 [Pseudomonas syringae pv. actinidiae]OSN29889.1 hypothetical protein BV342_05272 [Pseudomonas syringae pv. actinidiae]OSN45526.1 hypothetical protein BV345_05011 [Pseudomonas syringae pv. actinidiae]